MIKKIINKTFTLITIAGLLFGQIAVPVQAIAIPDRPAINVPDAPNISAPDSTSISVPEAPSIEVPDAPNIEAPTEPEITTPPAPEIKPVSQTEPSSTPDPTKEPPENTDSPTQTENEGTADSQGQNNSQTEDNASSPSSSDSGEQTGGQSADKQTGDPKIKTGDATNTVVVATDANSNADNQGGSDSGGSDVTVENSDNGSDSTNSGSATIVENNDTTQNNSATVENSLTQSTTSGNNSASRNTGGSSTIISGDANTSGTVVTTVNTNTAGVMVSEFDIVDDHMGDYVLDFAANCISGCDGGSANAKNTNNGSGSQNAADVELISNDITFQNNDATLENDLVLASNSGDNRVDRNTGGDSTIVTGDANVSANVLNLANNNLQGNIIYGVVNVYGDLVGDILFPEEYYESGVTAANIGNGDNSTNTASIDQTNSNTTTQTNAANIDNNLILAATSGDNSTSRNTNGNSSIKTGEANVDAQVLNVANSNVSGGNWFLVLVNEAGQWVGKIFGGEEGVNYAGSPGTEFTVDENGKITAVNSGNGAGSTNNSDITTVNNNSAVQTNNANIVNNVNLSANTGGNSASRNTGGNNLIETGDAKIIANIVNFVNNNITGGGNLFVTTVNVFGSWIGDFVTPWSSKEDKSVVYAEQTQKDIAQVNNSDSDVKSRDTSDNSSMGVGGVQPIDDQNKNSGSSRDSNNDNGSTNIQISDSSQQPDDTEDSLVAITDNKSPRGKSSSVNWRGIVAGISTHTLNQNQEGGLDNNLVGGERTASKKAININLAWLILLLPLIGVWFFVKRIIYGRAI